MNRWIWTMAAVVVMGLITLGFAHRRAVPAAAKLTPAAPGGVSVPPMTDPPATVSGAGAAQAIGYGLTFAVVNDPTLPSDQVSLSCQGEPAQVERPHKEACNPYQGDTSCRTVLPVLCAKPAEQETAAGAAPAHPATRANLGATQPVMGAILESEAAASARCEKELGAGWRMSEFVEGPDAWSLQGHRGLGLMGNNRYWVHAKGQRANCWNSAP